jgi:hypothetical protein
VYFEQLNNPTLESTRAILEKKAKIYDKLTKGKTGGLTEKQYDSLLVDVRPTINTSTYSLSFASRHESSSIRKLLTITILVTARISMNH